MKGTALFRHSQGKGALHLHRQMLKPQKSQQLRWCAALLAMLVCMLLAPQTCLPLCMATPLMACLLINGRYRYYAWAAVAVPLAVGLMEGWDMLYAASLMLPCGLSLLVTCLPDKKRAGTMGILLYVGASTVSLLMIYACAAQALGGPLADTLTEIIVTKVRTADRSDQLLLALVQSGLIAPPRAYEGAVISPLGLDPVLRHQLLLALEYVCRMLLNSLLPQLFVQGTLLSGLFTAFRVRKAQGMFVVLETQPLPGGRCQAHVAVQPGFRFVGLPKEMGFVLAGMLLLSLPLQAESGFAYTLGCLFSQMFVSCFAIQGAAVLVCAVSVKYPRRLTLVGGLSAALYLVSPQALVLMGIIEQVFHYREKLLKDQKKDS